MNNLKNKLKKHQKIWNKKNKNKYKYFSYLNHFINEKNGLNTIILLKLYNIF